MPLTVLIASHEHLQTLKALPDLSESTAFADTEALRAFETITLQRPSIVALERHFAATSRGTALVNRIKADPALSGCEIRIVSVDGTSGSPAAAVTAPQPPAVSLDQRGTRRVPRVPIGDGVEMLIDGNPAALVNLSVAGAQVLSPTVLKPNQRLRVLLPDAPRPIRLNSIVVWATFEMPKTGPRYRVGMEFFNPDTDALKKYCQEHEG